MTRDRLREPAGGDDVSTTKAAAAIRERFGSGCQDCGADPTHVLAFGPAPGALVLCDPCARRLQRLLADLWGQGEDAAPSHDTPEGIPDEA